MINAGTVFNNRYRLVSILATGGMGDIWRAWDQVDECVVAVKVLKNELTGQDVFLARLRAEAANASQLRHPNLAAVYDSGEVAGQGWIAMEMVEGRCLSDILAEEKTLPPARLLPILFQISRGLQVAHSRQIVHRDVKPSNILVSGSGVAKLTDFGISLGPAAATLTATGMVMGTAQYLPPEQAMGAVATGAGDIYALGIIAYEALAGRRPFTGTTQVDIAMAHVKDPVPPLSDDIDARLWALVMSMLEKDPAKRPADAQVLSLQIRELMKELCPHVTLPFEQSPPHLPTPIYSPHSQLNRQANPGKDTSAVRKSVAGGEEKKLASKKTAVGQQLMPHWWVPTVLILLMASISVVGLVLNLHNHESIGTLGVETSAPGLAAMKENIGGK